MVLYRYVHPLSGQSVTNRQGGYKQCSIRETAGTGGTDYAIADDSTFKASDLPTDPFTGSTFDLEDYISERSVTTNPIFDQLFVFRRMRTVDSDISTASQTVAVYTDVFEQVKGDPWFVASIKGSLESAMISASKLVRKIGQANVKIVKNVPTELTLDIE